MAEGVKYIKVAKIDKNGDDQTNSLQSLTELTIPYSTGNITYEILSITIHPKFFLYSVDNINIEHADRALIKYDVTASLNNLINSSPNIVNPRTVELTTITDNLLFLENFIESKTYTGTKYIFKTYPQKTINVQASGSLTLGDNTGDDHKISLSLNNSQIGNSVTMTGTGVKDFNLSSSILLDDSDGITGSAFPNDEISLIFQNLDTVGSTPSCSFNPLSLFIISSSAASGPTMETTPEPFLTQDFSRAFDCQPTLNNVSTNRLSNTYQDIDYTSNLMTPINFDLIISGSALKAEIQDSNYTLKRHILPRYEGSKSTSQFLNIFTNGDKGTYGTLPTAENLKTLVAYSGWTGGYLPEHNNAFGAHLKYLIKSNGDVVIPGTTLNALEDNKNIFTTGELVEISSEAQTSNGDPGEIRKVLRGGKRITPILTNQHGHSPAVFSSSLEMINKDGEEVGNLISDFGGSFTRNSNQYLSTTIGTNQNLSTQVVLSSGSNCVAGKGTSIAATRLIISQSMIDQGITLDINSNLNFHLQNPFGSTEIAAFVKNISTGEILASSLVNGDGILEGGTYGKLTLNASIPPTKMVVGHEYGIQINTATSTGLSAIFSTFAENTLQYAPYVVETSTFRITQYPAAGNTISTSGLWTSGSLADNPSRPWPYTIISTHPTIVNYYGAGNAKQENNVGSGFFNFESTWELNPGDEFRFEGKEDRVYMVKEAYVSGSKLFIEVDKPLPLSGSVPFINIGESGSINYNNFLIRRYVDDPSGLILEGEKPIGAGPYIIKPQYINQELNENLPTYIENLKEKGLI